MGDRLTVYQGARKVGDVVRQDAGRLAFAYAQTWLEDDDAWPISASLPLVPGLNTGLAAHAFFTNLLPEGSVREAVARQLGLSVSNDFGLLEAIGGECAGALAILPDDTSPGAESGGYERLDTSLIADMAKRFSVLAEVTGRHFPRLSLAGAQDKLPVRVREDGSIWLPVGGSPSTHILKVPSRDFKHLPANEVLVTRLARAVSLTGAVSLAAVDIDLARFDDVEIAVVRRYDRVIHGETVERLHQEDLCQALGLMAGAKYEQEGGPDFAVAMHLVRDISVEPIVDAHQLLLWIVFGLLAGNSDGHGKNLSLLYPPGGDHRGRRLAPFYDLICTRSYSTIDRRLAMSIGSQRDPGLIGRGHWLELSESVDVGRRLIIRIVEEMASELPQAFDQVAQSHLERHGESPAIQRIRSVIHKQCRRTLRLLAS